LRFLESNWTSVDQLSWIQDAKCGLKSYFDKWYTDSRDPFASPSPSPVPPARARAREEDQFDQWVKSRRPRLLDATDELERYYRLDPQDVEDPIQWWLGQVKTFPRLSRLALDILAIPAMASDCERQFSIAKLLLTSQRHRLQEGIIEQIQLMKNWVKRGGIQIGNLLFGLG
jgi:hypothetical protein